MQIPIHKIENYTNVHQLDVHKVPVIKRKYYFVDDSVSIDGEAPKKFIEELDSIYFKESRPKIGWEGEKNPNHFQLFQQIYANEFYNELRRKPFANQTFL